MEGRRGVRPARGGARITRQLTAGAPAPAGSGAASAAATAAHLREGRRLEYVTIGWNVIEGVVSVVAGVLAGSTALVGFGVDSAIDSRQTSLCAYLSAILLAGLLLNATLGWWWADPVAALVMVPIIVNEGVEALRGERCEAC